MTDKIRVLIADDHTIVRSGVRLLLQAEPDIEVVGEALSGDEAVTLAEALRPDVILMDIAMPGKNGLEATRQIKARFPDMDILGLTMHRSDEYFFEMLRAGASGYVLKAAETSELIGAIRVVARGEVFLYPVGEATPARLPPPFGRLGDAWPASPHAARKRNPAPAGGGIQQQRNRRATGRQPQHDP
jgi:two-component system response regulator NreC